MHLSQSEDEEASSLLDSAYEITYDDIDGHSSIGARTESIASSDLEVARPGDVYSHASTDMSDTDDDTASESNHSVGLRMPVAEIEDEEPTPRIGRSTASFNESQAPLPVQDIKFHLIRESPYNNVKAVAAQYNKLKAMGLMPYLRENRATLQRASTISLQILVGYLAFSVLGFCNSLYFSDPANMKDVAVGGNSALMNGTNAAVVNASITSSALTRTTTSYTTTTTTRTTTITVTRAPPKSAAPPAAESTKATNNGDAKENTKSTENNAKSSAVKKTKSKAKSSAAKSKSACDGPETPHITSNFILQSYLYKKDLNTSQCMTYYVYRMEDDKKVAITTTVKQMPDSLIFHLQPNDRWGAIHLRLSGKNASDKPAQKHFVVNYPPKETRLAEKKRALKCAAETLAAKTWLELKNDAAKQARIVADIATDVAKQANQDFIDVTQYVVKFANDDLEKFANVTTRVRDAMRTPLLRAQVRSRGLFLKAAGRRLEATQYLNKAKAAGIYGKKHVKAAVKPATPPAKAAEPPVAKQGKRLADIVKADGRNSFVYKFLQAIAQRLNE